MRAWTVSVAAILVAAWSPLAGQQLPPPRSVTALPADGRAPRLDGRLDDAIWAEAEPARDFILREPTEGAPAPERTEVRFVYTRDALYVGARMFSDAPAGVRRAVARRDREPPTERFVVSLDSRADRRTAYTFAVSPGGVRVDYFHPADFEGDRDYTYDPVWEAETRIDSLGWVAELRLPFAQLRYNPGREQVWGVNLMRLVPARNEEAFWVLVARNETGWSSRMGRLLGIADLPPARRLELSPYFATDATRAGEFDASDPFAQRYSTGMRVGGDVKMGLGPNVTLEATFNPDFGQVEADPAEVNLTAFETFFEERRPFFVEGSDLLGGRGTFYSRRIGAPPPGFASTTYSEAADNTTILGAAKVTGRLPSGLAIGGLAAVTARERIATYDESSGTYGTEVVAPLTVYGAATARQEVGRDRSTLAATFTVVERDLEPGSSLAALVARRALTGLVDGRLRWAGGRYDASAFLGVSHVSGDSLAILGLQQSSRRYFQRPDAGHVELDPGRTSLTGVIAGINHSKLAGALRWDIDYVEERPELELNDIGSLGSADDRGLFWDIYYRGTKPGPVLHSWTTGFFQGNEWNFDGDRKLTQLGAWWDGTLRGSFLRPAVEVSTRLRALSDDQTRGGPLMATAATWSLFLALRAARTARTAWDLEAEVAGDELGQRVFETEAGVSLRPGTQWDIRVEASFRSQTQPRQYVATRGGGPAATYGGRYIFARLERTDVVMQLRAAYALTPDLTLDLYAEPFASSGIYGGFGELAAARGLALRTYGTSGTTITRNGDTTYTVTDGASTFGFDVPDFDVRSLRTNLVLRWEWRPGSTLFFVWQQNRLGRTVPRANVGAGGLLDTFEAPGDQFVALKVSYWWAVR
jgi:hypothetical protein